MSNEQKPFDFVSEAHVTVSDKYYGELVGLHHFGTVAAKCIEAAEELDAIKKTLFYGRECGVPAPSGNEETMHNAFVWLSQGTDKDAEAKNVIHAIIGKVTEAGELLEALAKCLVEGANFDEVNVIEETGDGLWYDAILLRALGSSFEETQRINIAKLRQRFPDKFAEYDANNRDLFEERKILENSSKTA